MPELCSRDEIFRAPFVSPAFAWHPPAPAEPRGQVRGETDAPPTEASYDLRCLSSAVAAGVFVSLFGDMGGSADSHAALAPIIGNILYSKDL